MTTGAAEENYFEKLIQFPVGSAKKLPKSTFIRYFCGLPGFGFTKLVKPYFIVFSRRFFMAYTVDVYSTVSGETISNEGTQIVHSGGITYNVTVNGTMDWDSQIVEPGGTASNTYIYWAYATQEVAGSADHTCIEDGTQKILSGGIATGTYTQNDISHGSQIISSGGKSVNAFISAGGTQEVAGSAVSATIKGGLAEQIVVQGGVVENCNIEGSVQDVNAGGTAINTKIYNGGVSYITGTASQSIIGGTNGSQYIAFAGKATGTTIASNGKQIVSGTSLNTIIDAGTQTVTSASAVASAGYASDTTIKNGGVQNVTTGASAIETSVQDSSVQYVYSGGYAKNTTLTGGTQSISTTGLAEETTIKAGGSQNISSGGLVSGTIIQKNGVQNVYKNGKATETSVETGGIQHIWGQADSTTVLGQQVVYSNGYALDATISKGGVQIIREKGGITSNVLLLAGASQVTSAGSAIGTDVRKGAVQIISAGNALDTKLAGKQTVYDYASGTVIESGGVQIVSMATAEAATINTGGKQEVYGSGSNYGSAVGTVVNSQATLLVGANGIASAAQISSGGVATIKKGGRGAAISIEKTGIVKVLSSGYVTSTNIGVGGTLTLSKGAEAYNTVIASTGKEQVLKGGVSYSAVISAGGSQTVAAGGVAQNVTVSTDGIQDVSGSVWSAQVEDKATQNILKKGTASAITLSGTQNVSGSVTNVLVDAKGIQNIYKGGKATSCTVSSGGIQNVYGTVLNDTVTGKGKVYVFSGGKTTQAQVASGGEIIISKGGKDISSFISGTETVNSGGVASNTVLNNSAKQVVKGKAVRTSAVGSSLIEVHGGGITTSAFIGTEYYDGGTMHIKAKGLDSGSVINAAGSQIVSAGGSAVNTQIYGSQIVRGTANNVTLYSGGTLVVSKGGVVNNVTVMSGVEFNDVVINKGTISSWRLTSGVSMGITEGYTIGGNMVLGDNATLFGGTAKKTVNLGKGKSITAEKNADMADLYLNVGSGSLILEDSGTNVGYLKLGAASTIVYDIRDVAAKDKSSMLYLSETNSQKKGVFQVITKKAQTAGKYELSESLKQNKNTAYSISLGSKALGTAKLNGTALTANGLTYSVKTAGSDGIVLNVGLKAGKMFKGNAKANKQTGTTSCDIFYGGKGNDTISGNNGRDVAVYDTTNWGKDVISKTSGTMTLLFNNVKKNQVSTKTSGKDLIITKKSDAKQTITVKNWNANTHNIVYGSGLTAFNTYLKAASPSTKQVTAARNEVWKKAGLASS